MLRRTLAESSRADRASLSSRATNGTGLESARGTQHRVKAWPPGTEMQLRWPWPRPPLPRPSSLRSAGHRRPPRSRLVVERRLLPSPRAVLQLQKPAGDARVERAWCRHGPGAASATARSRSGFRQTKPECTLNFFFGDQRAGTSLPPSFQEHMRNSAKKKRSPLISFCQQSSVFMWQTSHERKFRSDRNLLAWCRTRAPEGAARRCRGIVAWREQVCGGPTVYGHHFPAARVSARAHSRVKACLCTCT